MTRALITNDDGIASEGLTHLARVACDIGLDVVVAAPLDDASGSSAALTAVRADGRVVVERRRLNGLPDVDAYAVGAVPAFITLLATRRAFGPAPDFVLSGINRGANTGHAVLHSGTVGAALTGATHGCRAAAISIAVETDKPIRWATAAHVVRRMVPWIMDDTISTAFNINVPNCDLENLRGIREAALARFGAVQTNVVERGEGFVRLAVEDTNSVLEEGTDAALLTHGYATVTALEPLCATISTGLTRFLSRSDRT